MDSRPLGVRSQRRRSRRSWWRRAADGLQKWRRAPVQSHAHLGVAKVTRLSGRRTLRAGHGARSHRTVTPCVYEAQARKLCDGSPPPVVQVAEIACEAWDCRPKMLCARRALVVASAHVQRATGMLLSLGRFKAILSWTAFPGVQNGGATCTWT